MTDDNRRVLCLPFFFADVFGVLFLRLLLLAGIFKVFTT